MDLIRKHHPWKQDLSFCSSMREQLVEEPNPWTDTNTTRKQAGLSTDGKLLMFEKPCKAGLEKGWPATREIREPLQSMTLSSHIMWNTLCTLEGNKSTVTMRQKVIIWSMRKDRISSCVKTESMLISSTEYLQPCNKAQILKIHLNDFNSHAAI